MLLRILLIVVSLANCATASIVYDVSHTFAVSEGGVGSILIDGWVQVDALGVQTTSTGLGFGKTGIIDAWNLSYSNPGGTLPPTTLTHANSAWLLFGSEVSATATSLFRQVNNPPFSMMGSQNVINRSNAANDLMLIIANPQTPLSPDPNDHRELFRVSLGSVPARADFTTTISNGRWQYGTIAVPEPSCLSLVGLPLLAIAQFWNRKRQRLIVTRRSGER